MSRKGKTRWFPRHIEPVRPGQYECAVRLPGIRHALVLWSLVWDGKGFLVPVPMSVHQWRGLTKRAALDAARTEWKT